MKNIYGILKIDLEIMLSTNCWRTLEEIDREVKQKKLNYVAELADY